MKARDIRIAGVDRFTLLLAALGLLAALLILLRQSAWGAGLTIDSTLYISAARNLLDGNGLVSWTGRPYQDAAPLFPLVLASLGLFGVDAIEAAGYVNAAAFGLTVFATTMWLRSRIRSRFLTVWAGCGCALSASLAHVSAQAMTEALFILFVVLSLFALSRFLDTNKRSFLLMAALFAGLACLTRHIGVTLIGSGLLILLLQRDTSFLRRTGNASTYFIVAIIPFGAWILRNLLVIGSLTGRVYPNDFSALASLENAIREFSLWVFGKPFGKFGLDILSGLSIQVAGVTVPGHALAWMIAALIPIGIGVGCAFTRLRSMETHRLWDMMAVPVVFVSVYALFLIIFLPLADVNLPRRYLTPIFPPLLVSATMILSEFPRCISKVLLQGILPFSGKRSVDDDNRMTAGIPSPVMKIFLSLWLILWIVSNYEHINHWIDRGHGYSSRDWANSETIRYLRDHPLDGTTWTTESRALYLLTPTRGRYGPHWLSKSKRKMKLRLAKARAENKEIYVVWFYRKDIWTRDYNLEELASLSGVEFVKAFPDGIIIKFPATPNAYVETSLRKRILMGVTERFEQIIFSDFAVYLDEGKKTLVYVKHDCDRDDTGPKFFLHIVPVEKIDLPRRRWPHGFDNRDFSFSAESWGSVGFGLCVVTRGLPDYPIASIRTGQYIPGKGRLWEGEFVFDR